MATGENLDLLPTEAVILMRNVNGGDIDNNRDIYTQNVAIISEKTPTTATFVWTIDANYSRVLDDYPKAHTWQGIYTPYNPPREIVEKFD